MCIRDSPIVAAEYFLEPVDGQGGLFPPWRVAFMRGAHSRLSGPRPDEVYVAAVDLAGQDEGAAEVGAQLRNPGRDYTVVTIFRVETEFLDGTETEFLPKMCIRDSVTITTP